MLGEVTQDNLHLFIPGKVAGVAVLLAEERGISPEEALVEFYGTRTYRLLENEKSKYWHYSPEQLYQTMKEQTDENEKINDDGSGVCRDGRVRRGEGRDGLDSAGGRV